MLAKPNGARTPAGTRTTCPYPQEKNLKTPTKPLDQTWKKTLQIAKRTQGRLALRELAQEGLKVTKGPDGRLIVSPAPSVTPEAREKVKRCREAILIFLAWQAKGGK